MTVWKTVVIAYLSGQTLLMYFALMLQGVNQEVVEVVTESNNFLSLLNYEHPLIGMFGQIMYVMMVYYRRINKRDSGEQIKVWSLDQTQMLFMRIVFAAVGSFIASTVIIHFGDQQTWITVPSAFKTLFIYGVDMAIGYFVIRGLTVEFEDKVANKLKDQLKL